MDFGSLLQIAQQKTKEKRNDVTYYKTKFEPPKKETKSKQLSENIQRFIARKEAEERQKAEEARLKKLRLLELRAQDKGSSKRVQSMLQRTKSANKSAIDDAVDKKNTAVTITGCAQPDEDDYGYESQSAAALYQKMIDKYNSAPVDKKFPSGKKSVSTNLTGTKDRVKAALLKEEQDALLPHKRKRRHHETNNNDADNNSDDDKDKHDATLDEKKSRKRPVNAQAPPPINFNDLLKLAEQKQHEPIYIEPKKEVEAPLMTKKQRLEYEREKARRDAKELRDKQNSILHDVLSKPNRRKNPNSNSPSSAIKAPEKFVIPRKDKDNLEIKKPVNSTNQTSTYNLSKTQTKPSDVKPASLKPVAKAREKDDPVTSRVSSVSKIEKSRNPTNASSKPSSQPVQQKKYPENSKPSTRPVEKPRNVPDLKPTTSKATKPPVKSDKFDPKLRKPNVNESERVKTKQMPPPRAIQSSQTRQFPPKDVQSRVFPPKDVQSRQFPPADVRAARPFPPKDVQSREFPPRDVRKKQTVQVKKRRIIDSDDEEYDSEMDDFIDDGPEEESDYSKHIKEIFGYDKSRYRAIDEEDDEAMESKFSTIMREDYISTKLGIMEDLEDMKMEQEQKKRKAMAMKKRVK